MKPVSELFKNRPNTLWSLRPDDTVYEAIKVFAEKGVGALMVMDKGKLVGILSERDYTRKIALQGKNSKETKVSEIMTRNVFVVKPTSRTRECMAIMSENNFRHLPVVDGDTVVGMVSIRDLMNDIITENEMTISQLESYIKG